MEAAPRTSVDQLRTGWFGVPEKWCSIPTARLCQALPRLIPLGAHNPLGVWSSHLPRFCKAFGSLRGTRHPGYMYPRMRGCTLGLGGMVCTWGTAGPAPALC